MRKIKRYIAVLSAVLMLIPALALFGCKKEADSINVAVPDGLPALSVLKLNYENAKIGNTELSFSVLAGADALKARLISLEADIAIVPANLASILYNLQGDYQFAGTVINSNSYFIGKNALSSIADLKNSGAVIYSLGGGGVPEYTLKHILNENGISYAAGGDVTLSFKTGAVEIIPQLKSTPNCFAVLSEPVLTAAQTSVSGLVSSLSISELWGEIEETSSYPQAVLVMRSYILRDYKEVALAFIEKLEDSIDWILTSDNLSAAATYLDSEEFKAKGSTLSGDSLKNAAHPFGLGFKDGETGISEYKKFLEIIYKFNANAVGGKMPDNSFYHYF